MAYYDILESPLGTLFVGGSAAGLHRIDFLDEAAPGVDHSIARLECDAGEPAVRDAAAAADARQVLAAYWHGECSVFELPLAARGTAFQAAVWTALLEIAPSATTTYGAIAQRLDRPTASRAVGAAIGCNPLAVVVPCHRVIGTGGALTGFAWGLDRKRWLLAHEARVAAAGAGGAAPRMLEGADVLVAAR